MKIYELVLTHKLAIVSPRSIYEPNPAQESKAADPPEQTLQHDGSDASVTCFCKTKLPQNKVSRGSMLVSGCAKWIWLGAFRFVHPRNVCQ